MCLLSLREVVFSACPNCTNGGNVNHCSESQWDIYRQKLGNQPCTADLQKTLTILFLCKSVHITVVSLINPEKLCVFRKSYSKGFTASPRGNIGRAVSKPLCLVGNSVYFHKKRSRVPKRH